MNYGRLSITFSVLYFLLLSSPSVYICFLLFNICLAAGATLPVYHRTYGSCLYWYHFGPFIFVSVDSLTPLSLPYSAVTWDSHIYYRCPLLLVNYYCVCLFGWQLLVNLELKIP